VVTVIAVVGEEVVGRSGRSHRAGFGVNVLDLKAPRVPHSTRRVEKTWGKKNTRRGSNWIEETWGWKGGRQILTQRPLLQNMRGGKAQNLRRVGLWEKGNQKDPVDHWGTRKEVSGRRSEGRVNKNGGEG